MKKKILSYLMIICLLVGMVPVPDVEVQAATIAAMIGDTGYASLEEAVSAAADGSSIVMVAEDSTNQQITISKSLTIDLMGHNLTATRFKINAGNVVIRDTLGIGAINTTGASGIYATDDAGFDYKSRVCSTICVQGTANVSLNNVTVHYGSGDLMKAIYLGGTSANLTINGGNYMGYNSSGGNALFFYNGNQSTLTVNDGYFYGAECISTYPTATNITNTLHLIKAHLVSVNGPFYIEGGDRLITTPEGIAKFVDLNVSSVSYTNPGDSYAYKDIWVTSKSLFLSPGFNGPQYGSTDPNAPADIQLGSGESVSLEAQVLGGNGNVLSYQWYKDGEAIGGATGNRYDITGFDPAAQSGLYSTIVTDNATSLTLYWNVAGDATTPPVVEHIHDEVTYTTAFTATSGEVSSGNYYLTNDITATGEIKISGSAVVNLCLNGYTLDMGENYLTVSGKDTIVNIYDCNGNAGKITGTNREYGTIRNYYSTLSLYSGVVSNTLHNGIFNNSGTVNVLGGVVESVNNAIRNDTGTVLISGGTVKSTGANKAAITNNNGNGKGGTIIVSGGIVTGEIGIQNSTYCTVEVTGTGKVEGTGSATIPESGGGSGYGITSESSAEVIISGGTVSSKNSSGVKVSGTLSVSGGNISSANEYAVYVRGSNGELYLSGNPVISGNEAGYADIGSDRGSVYGHEKDDASSLYTGNAVTVKAISASEGTVVVKELTEANRELFELLNTSSGDVFIPEAGEGSGSNLVIHKHKYTYGNTAENIISESCTCGYSETAAITAPTGDLVYDGTTNFTADVTYSANWKGGTLTVSYKKNSTAVTDIIDAGNYTASISKGDITAVIDYTVELAEGSITDISDIGKVYDGTAVSAPDFTNLGTGSAVITYKEKDADDSTYTTVKPRNAGEYTLCITVETDGNYKKAAVTKDFTITAKEISLLWTAPENLVYDGGAKVPSVEAAGLVPGDTISLDTACSADCDNVNVGSFTYDVTGLSNENYKLPSNVTSPSYTITGLTLQKETFSVNLTGYVYTGSEIKPVVSSVNPAITMNDYEVVYSNNIKAGTDTAKITITAKGNALGSVEFTFTIEKAQPENITFPSDVPVDIVVPEGNTLKLSDIVLPEEFSEANGYRWENPDTLIAYGSHNYVMVYTPADTENYRVIKQNITITGKDVTNPTGEITVSENKWNSFLNQITFGIFFKETQSVTITGADTESGVRDIYYYLSQNGLSETEVENISDWTLYNTAFNINPDNEYVVYAKITDNAGNFIYISSDGMVLDETKPVLTGLTEGTVYCKPVEVTVRDKYLDKVTVNGTEVTITEGKFTLQPAEGTQRVVAYDKAGNESISYTITVNHGHTYVYETKKPEGMEGQASITETCQYCAEHTAEVILSAPEGQQVYNGMSHDGKLTFTGTFKDGNNLVISYTRDGEATSSTLEAGNYEASISLGGKTIQVSYKVEKVLVTLPVLDSKVYNGEIQIGDVAENPLYTVTENAGGKEAGSFNVVLKLTDTVNYKWAKTEEETETISFAITPKEIGLDWTGPGDLVFDNTAKVPKVKATGLCGSDVLNVTARPSSGADNVNKGTFTFVAAEIDNPNYKLPAETTSPAYTITAKLLNSSEEKDLFVLEVKEFSYTGQAVTPEVTYKGTELSPADYEITYENNITVGTGIVRITGKGNGAGTIEISFTIKKAVQEDVQFPADLTGNGSGSETAAGKLSDIVLPDGFAWENPDTLITYGPHEYVMIYTPADPDNYEVIKESVIVTGLDITKPTGEITVSENKWNSFLNQITFGIFFKETQSVTITGADTESGVKTVEYYLSDKGLTETEAEALSDWNTYTKAFSINPEKKYVVYARITDNAGNLVIISSDGMVLETKAPEIHGVISGKTYCGAVTIVIVDENLKEVTVNNKAVTLDEGNSLVISPAAENQTIQVIDEAGNTAAATIKVNDGHTYGDKVCGDCGVSKPVTPQKPSNPDTPSKPEAEKTYSIQGNLIDAQKKPVPNAVVQLKQGHLIIKAAKTDASGTYKFTGLKAGTYNLVATKDDQIVTSLVVITNANVEKDLLMPTYGINSKLVVEGNNTPNIVAGGLDSEAAAQAESNGGIAANTEITITMNVAEKSEEEIDASADVQLKEAKDTIQEMIEESDTSNGDTESEEKMPPKGMDFFEIKVSKTITTEGQADNVTAVEETHTVLELVVPYDFAGKENIKVYRHHNNKAESFTELSQMPTAGAYADKTYYLNKEAECVHIYTQKFSLYAIGYTEAVNNSDGSVTGGYVPAPTVPSGTNQKDSEPKTGDYTPVEIYATVTMIAGYGYLLLYFKSEDAGMTESRKKELVDTIIHWAKQGGMLRRLLGIVAIFFLLAYYHYIGKQIGAKDKYICQN